MASLFSYRSFFATSCAEKALRPRLPLPLAHVARRNGHEGEERWTRFSCADKQARCVLRGTRGRAHGSGTKPLARTCRPSRPPRRFDASSAESLSPSPWERFRFLSHPVLNEPEPKTGIPPPNVHTYPLEGASHRAKAKRLALAPLSQSLPRTGARCAVAACQNPSPGKVGTAVPVSVGKWKRKSHAETFASVG